MNSINEEWSVNVSLLARLAKIQILSFVVQCGAPYIGTKRNRSDKMHY